MILDSSFIHRGILVECSITCPTCAECAKSFRILRVNNPHGSIDAEFYHPTATCAGSMVLSKAAALDLLRLALDFAVNRPNVVPWR